MGITYDSDLIFPKKHIGAVFVALGTVFLFAGSGNNLQMAGNHLFFIVAILLNILDFLLGSKKIKFNYLLFSFGYLFVVVCFFFLFGMASSGEGLSLLLIFLLLISIMLCDYNRADLDVIVFGVIISGLILSLLLLLFGKGYSGAIYDKYTYTQTFGSRLEFEPNFLALSIITSCEFSIWKAIVLIQSNKTKIGILYVLIAGITLIAALRTGSRAVLLAFAIYVLALVMFMKNQKIKRYIFYMIVIGIILFIVAMMNGIISERIFDRLFEFDKYLDNSNLHRLKNWFMGIKAMFSSLLGYGIKNTSVILKNLYDYPSAAHNTFIALGMYFGLFGMLIICGIFFSIVIALWKKNKVLFSLFISMIALWNILECQYSIAMTSVMIICFIASKKEITIMKNYK